MLHMFEVSRAKKGERDDLPVHPIDLSGIFDLQFVRTLLFGQNWSGLIRPVQRFARYARRGTAYRRKLHKQVHGDRKS